MAQSFVERDSLGLVLREQLGDEVLRVIADRVPTRKVKHKLLFERHSDSLLLRLVIEGQRSGKHGVENATQAPNVTRKSVWLFPQDLRRDVAESAKRLSGFFVGPDDLGQSKVNDLWNALFRVVAHHNVLELEIAMDDTEVVQVLDSQPYLVTKVLHTGLTEVELAPLDVVKHVFAGHEVQNDEVVIGVFEDVDKFDDILVLAHFEHLNLATLLDDLDLLHVGLLNCLDGKILAILFVRAQLNKSELTFAKRCGDVVEVRHRGEPQRLIQHTNPVLLNFRTAKVQNAGLAGWKHNFDWEVELVRVRVFFRLLFFDESTRKAVHHTGLLFVLVPIAKDLVAAQDSPMLLESVRFGLQEAFTS